MIQENKTASATPLLFCLLFVLFSSVILGDNIAESLLISNFDPSILPVMFIVNSIFLLLFSLFFINLIDRVDRGRFMLAVLAVHACCLLGIRVLISLKIPFIFPIIYSYSYASKMMIFILFWTIANDITDARKAKETFPIIAGGGVAGGVLISYSVVFLIRIIPAEDLLFVWAGLLVAATPLVLVIYRRYFSMLKSSTRLPGTDGVLAQISENYQLVRSEPLLKSMAAIYFLSFILLFAQDYLFLSTLKQTFIAGKAYFVKGARHFRVCRSGCGHAYPEEGDPPVPWHLQGHQQSDNIPYPVYRGGPHFKEDGYRAFHTYNADHFYHFLWRHVVHTSFRGAH